MKRSVLFLVLLIIVFMGGKAYCQNETNGPLISTISGKVVAVEPEGGIVSVLTEKGIMVFNITSQSNLLRYTARMTSIDIEQGDPVTILYDSTKNDIIRLVDKKADTF